MAEVYQADVDALSDLGHRMKNAADRMDGIRAELNAALAHNHWQGEDADAFRSQWSYRLTGLLLTAVNAARAASTSLATNVDQQIQASSAEGGGSSLTGFLKGFGDVLHDEYERVDVLRNATVGLRAVEMLGKNGVEWATNVDPELLKTAEDAEPALVIAALGLSLADFSTQFALNRNSNATWNAGADVVFNTAATVALFSTGPAGPAIFLGIEGAHMAYDLVTDLDPQLTHQIVGAFGDTAKAVITTDKVIADGVIDIGKSVINTDLAIGGAVVGGAENAAKSLGGLVSGGFHSISKFL